LQERVRPFVVVMQAKKALKRPRLTTERKRKEKKRAPSSSPIDIAGTLARLQEKHTIAQKEQKEGKELDFDDFAPALKLLKGILFKADTPYRTRLAYSSTLATTSGGALAIAVDVSSVNSVNQWSSLDVLFDQVFIHAMTVRYMPRNVVGGGWGSSGGANATTTAPTGGTNAAIQNTALIMAAIFGSNSAYSSASAMVNNPNKKIAHSAHAFSYAWRNNVRFDPRGYSLALSTPAWQGWIDIGNVTDYGGLVQIRSFNDVLMGSTTAIQTLGDLLISFDISFRARI